MPHKIKKIKATKKINTINHYYNRVAKSKRNNYYEDLNNSIAKGSLFSFFSFFSCANIFPLLVPRFRGN